MAIKTNQTSEQTIPNDPANTLESHAHIVASLIKPVETRNISF